MVTYRRDFPVVDVVAALGPFSQPELLNTITPRDSDDMASLGLHRLERLEITASAFEGR